MAISSLEQHLIEQKKTGNLTRENITNALQSGEYLYNIRDTSLKRDIYTLLMSDHTDTTTMYYVD